jgi:hypothetical protein
MCPWVQTPQGHSKVDGGRKGLSDVDMNKRQRSDTGSLHCLSMIDVQRSTASLTTAIWLGWLSPNIATLLDISRSRSFHIQSLLYLDYLFLARLVSSPFVKGQTLASICGS